MSPQNGWKSRPAESLGQESHVAIYEPLAPKAYDNGASPNRVVCISAFSAHRDVGCAHQLSSRCRRIRPYGRRSALTIGFGLCLGALLRLVMEASLPSGGLAWLVSRSPVCVFRCGVSGSDRLFPRPVFVCPMRTQPGANHSIQRRRASRSGCLQFSRHRRLALTADADRWTE